MENPILIVSWKF